MNSLSWGNSVQHTFNPSDVANSSGSLDGAPNDSSAHSASVPLKPILRINVAIANDTSPLTMPTTASDAVWFQQSFSARRVEYDVTEDGVVLSVTIASQLLYSNNSNNQTYQEGYDSDAEIGPFLDAVRQQRSNNDEIFNNVEYEARESPQPAPEQQDAQTITQAILPNYNAMTVAQLKDELLKLNLPV